MSIETSEVTAARLAAVYERAAAEAPRVLAELVSYDTTIREHDDPARQEAGHQRFVADYLRDLGATVEVWEPENSEFDAHPMYRPGQNFEGRPIVWASLAGTGGGRSLLFNGHMDTVVVDPLEDWAHNPWGGEIVDGRLYGRGSCDMKGGIACAMAVAEAFVAEGVSTAGDLLFNFAPFEEVNGMGTTATMLAGRRADAAICCEPTELQTLVGCRGILLAEITVDGRAAHAEIPQPDHREGGGVNAIDKLIAVLSGFKELNARWLELPQKQHPLLSTPTVLTTLISGGTFASTWPPEASATINVCYLPAEVDDDGYGSRVMAELQAAVDTVVAGDSWLQLHPPRVEWLCDFPAKELSGEHDLVTVVGAAAVEQGVVGHHLVGFDTWADQVMLMKEGGMPAVCFGPGSITNAHAVDEYVPLSDLATCARVYADAALRWCGDGAAATEF